MTIVPLHIHGAAILKLQAVENWCTYKIGRESPYTWYTVEVKNSGININMDKFREFNDAGVMYSIVFYKEEDATAFKLAHGLYQTKNYGHF